MMVIVQGLVCLTSASVTGSTGWLRNWSDLPAVGGT